MPTISQLLPAFNRLLIQPSTLRLARSYVTKTRPAVKASSPAKKTTPEKKTPGKKVATGKASKKVSPAKTTRKSVEVKKPEKGDPSKIIRKRRPKGLETALTNAPTLARSPWSLFIQANKEKFAEIPKEEGKRRNIGVVTTELSKKWKELPETERKDFEDKAALDKIRFQTEHAKWLASASVEDFKKENSLRRAEGKSKIKDPNAPKGLKNPYMYFSIAQREKANDSTVSITEYSKVLAEKWNGLSESEKAPYVELADIDKKRYYTEMKAYDPNRFLPKPPKAPKAPKADKAVN